MNKNEWMASRCPNEAPQDAEYWAEIEDWFTFSVTRLRKGGLWTKECEDRRQKAIQAWAHLLPLGAEPAPMFAESPPKATAPTFWFAERGFENSRTPCICMDNPTGGDPIIIAQVEPHSFWPMYVNAMCDAATRCFRMADELSEHVRKAQEEQERQARLLGGRPIAQATETHIDRECETLGHEFDLEQDSEEGARPACVHCGVEQEGW